MQLLFQNEILLWGVIFMKITMTKKGQYIKASLKWYVQILQSEYPNITHILMIVHFIGYLLQMKFKSNLV